MTAPDAAARGGSAPDAEGPRFCGYCGGGLAEPRHEACARRAAMEPPRYCAACARRMVVQVTPSGWSARCVAHGVITAG